MNRAGRFAALFATGTAMSVGLVTATPADAAVTLFPSSNSPRTGVTNGTVITNTGTGAQHNAGYYCVQVIVKVSPLTFAFKFASVKSVTSTAAGKTTCKQTFTAWQAKDSMGVVRHCPLTPADKAAGFHCGIALADKATNGKTSDSVSFFATA